MARHLQTAPYRLNYSICVCIFHNLLKMYLVTGGWSGSVTLDSTEIYDPDIGSWSARAALPSQTRHLRAASIDSRILIIGIDI